jgi:glutathione peroxidase
LKYVRPGAGYVPPFPIFSKIEVNGADSHPLWVMMREACASPSGIICPYDVIKWKPVTTADIGWNFEKVLISKKGIPIRRYDSGAMSDELTKDIEMLLAE